MTPGKAQPLVRHYRIDASHSSFQVQAFATGLLSFAGHDPTFSVHKYGGEITLTADGATANSLLVVVHAPSIFLIDKVSEDDRREIETTLREKILDTEKYPEITFVSQEISITNAADGTLDVIAEGYLSIHGEMCRQTIEAMASIDNENIYAEGEFRLKQSDFNLEQVTALAGTLKVKDEVKISFTIAAAI